MFGQCWCSTGGFFASEGGSRHRGFTIVLNQGKGRGVRRSCLDCTVLLSQADGPLAVTDLTAGVLYRAGAETPQSEPIFGEGMRRTTFQ